MKRLFAATLLALTFASGVSAQTGLVAPRYRNSNAGTQMAPPPDASACPSDANVWVSTTSGIYYAAGERQYGATKAGKYMCKKDADAAGYRMSKNGQ